ncbi:MAG: hypothetical protein ACYC6Y_08465 [Thermoguttaceae bacterium]
MADQFPSRVAASWFGHSEQIADSHYRQVTADHFRKAIDQPTETLPPLAHIWPTQRRKPLTGRAQESRKPPQSRV